MGVCGARMGFEDSTTAPNLDEYFRTLERETKQFSSSMTNVNQALALAQDRDGNQQRMQQQHIKLRPIIARAFDHHDTKKNGILDAEESKVFFDHYITRLAKFSKSMGKFQVQQSQKMALAMTGGMLGGGMASQMQDMMKQQANKAMKQSEKMIDDSLKQYRARPAQYNQAAFTLLDENKDGKLVKEVVVEAFMPGTAKNLAFSNCFPTGPEKMMQRAMGQMQAQLGPAAAGQMQALLGQLNQK